MNNSNNKAILFYIGSCFFSIFANVMGKFFVQGTNVSVMNLFLHVDIINLTICIVMILIVQSRKKIKYLEISSLIKYKRQLIFFSFPVLASVFKTYLLGFIHPTNMAISSFITPFFVGILGFIILKEKLIKNYFIYVTIACIGFYIANMENIALKFNANLFWIISYVILNSVSIIIIRFFALKRNFFEAVFIENFIYALYGIIFFSTIENFSFNVLFSYKTFLCSLAAFSHHFCIILAYKNSEKISNLQLLDFSKIIFAMIASYFFLRTIPTFYSIIGSILIVISLYNSNIKYKKILK